MRRDIKALAAAGARGTVGVRFCQSADLLAALDTHVTGAAAARKCDLVQVSHDFAVAQPVLRALQACVALPMPELAAAAGAAAAGAVAPPVWQNDGTVAPWLQGRVDMFDDAQRDAFTHALSNRVALVQGPPGAASHLLAVQVANFKFTERCAVTRCRMHFPALARGLT